MQASSIKRYPAQLSLTAWISMVGGIQSAVFAVFMQHKLEDWLIGFGLKFWCIVYTVCSNILWACAECAQTVLVFRVCTNCSSGNRLHWLHDLHSAMVQREERPRICYNVQSPLSNHGGRPSLLHLRWKSVSWKVWDAWSYTWNPPPSLPPSSWVLIFCPWLYTLMFSLICSIIGGVRAILGLYMLLWGKDKDQEHKVSKENESELDCEKQMKVDSMTSCWNDSQAPEAAPPPPPTFILLLVHVFRGNKGKEGIEELREEIKLKRWTWRMVAFRGCHFNLLLWCATHISVLLVWLNSSDGVSSFKMEWCHLCRSRNELPPCNDMSPLLFGWINKSWSLLLHLQQICKTSINKNS